ncbi:MAG: MvaI/BcnI family restriction endonuclease [Elusimicrobiota bacterium]
MTLKEFKSRLTEIEKLCFVQSKRKGSTGIGYTLEMLLNIKENNIKLPDLGEIELKSKRKNVFTFVTMFTFNSGVWKIHQSDVIKTYGYKDKQERKALKCFVRVTPNAQGLYLKVTKQSLQMYHTDKTLIAEWNATNLLQYFSAKVPSLILVLADTRKNEDNKEEFHYNEAYLLKTPSKTGLLKLIEQGFMVVDLRMHLKSSGAVRNRGTAFRVEEKNLIQCFAEKIKLL